MSRFLLILAAAGAAACSEGGHGGDAGPPADMALCYGYGLGPFGIAVDAEHVYWTGLGDEGNVWQAALDGGDRQPLARLGPKGSAYVRSMRLGDGALYVAAGCEGEIFRVPLDGSGAQSVAQTPGCVHDVAVGGDTLYYTTTVDMNGALWKVPIAGGTPAAIGGAATMGSGTCGEVVAVADTDVYWTDVCTKTLNKVPLAGGDSVVVDNEVGGEAVAIAGGNVYWDAAGQLKRAPLDGSSAPAVIATTTPMTAVWGIAVDGQFVYWSENTSFTDPGTIRRAPVDDSSAPTQVAESPYVGAIALGASSLYSIRGGTCLTIATR